MVGVPVPDAELVAAAVESVPLAFEDSPVYLVVVTPVPLVQSEAVESVLEKVMSAHCALSQQRTIIGRPAWGGR